MAATALAIPIIVFRTAQLTDDDTLESAQEKQYRQLVFYLFCWFLIIWLSACVSDMFILLFPTFLDSLQGKGHRSTLEVYNSVTDRYLATSVLLIKGIGGFSVGSGSQLCFLIHKWFLCIFPVCKFSSMAKGCFEF